MPNEKFPKIDLGEAKRARKIFLKDLQQEDDTSEADLDSKEATPEVAQELSGEVLKVAKIIAIDDKPLAILLSTGETIVGNVDWETRAMEPGDRIILEDPDSRTHMAEFVSRETKGNPTSGVKIKVRLLKPE